MYIKNLEIENFKSFKGNHNIPLLKGITAIIGPNGSDKTNLLNAINFAINYNFLKDNSLLFKDTENGFVKLTLIDEDENKEYTVKKEIDKKGKINIVCQEKIPFEKLNCMLFDSYYTAHMDDEEGKAFTGEMREKAKTFQILIETHKQVIINNSDRIIGITLKNGCSNIVGLTLKQAESKM